MSRGLLSLRAWRDPILVAISLVALWQVLHEIAGDSAVTAPAPTLAHLWEMIGHKLTGEVAEPILVALYSVPKITLYPVSLLLFGLGMPAKVAFGALHGIIPVVLFTMNAVRNVNRTYLRAGRAMRLTPAQTGWYVLVPATIPEIFSGLRIGFSLTLLGTMLGELFASQRGLGFLLMTAIDLHDVKTILSIAVLISVFAIASNAALLAIDRHLHRGAAPDAPEKS